MIKFNLLTILVLSLLATLLHSGQKDFCPVRYDYHLKTTGIITTLGKTQLEAYNKAKEMLSKKHPQAREKKVRYSQTGGKAVCRLYWEKD